MRATVLVFLAHAVVALPAHLQVPNPGAAALDRPASPSQLGESQSGEPQVHDFPDPPRSSSPSHSSMTRPLVRPSSFGEDDDPKPKQSGSPGAAIQKLDEAVRAVSQQQPIHPEGDSTLGGMISMTPSPPPLALKRTISAPQVIHEATFEAKGAQEPQRSQSETHYKVPAGYWDKHFPLPLSPGASPPVSKLVSWRQTSPTVPRSTTSPPSGAKPPLTGFARFRSRFGSTTKTKTMPEPESSGNLREY